MKYRRFGRTEMNVSVLGFGASSLGGVFREVRDAEAVKTVHAALDSGINFIDTSPFYGLHRSEEVLGRAFTEIARDRFFIATKVGRYGHNIEDCNYSAVRVKDSVDESLKRMGLEYVDLIQVHDMEFGDVDRIIHETIPALEEVKERGKARFIGVTCLPLKLLKRVYQAVDVDAIQSYCHYCLNDTALLDLLPELEEKEMGVISSAPLAMRLLTDAGPPDWHPAPPELTQACARAAAHCRERGADLAELAMQFSVANPLIHSVMVSTANPERIRRNVKTIEEPLDEELLREVMELIDPVRDLTWPQGRLENNE